MYGDRCKLPRVFWQALEQLGLQPSHVLRQANLPATLNLDDAAFITTPKLFAVWYAIEFLSRDPAFGIKMVRETRTAKHKLAFIAASYSADFREGIARIARFKRLCSPDLLNLTESGGKLYLTNHWPFGTEPEPPLSVDANFALVLELGRRGTGKHIVPLALTLRRRDPGGGEHSAYFACPIHFGASCDQMVLSAQDLDLSFIGHNPELLQMFVPALADAKREMEGQARVSDQVKLNIKRALASGNPDVARVAQEIGLSVRTLQRRIMEEGKTFRTLLNESKLELASQFLSDPSIDIKEVAYLLGYDDTNSFHRAFREWEGVTPTQWRQANRQSSSR